MDFFKKREIINRFIQKDTYILSSFSFVNIFIWKDFFDFQLKIINGSLCVFAHNIWGCFLYLPPLSRRISPGTIEECFRIMSKINQRPGISRIENVQEDHLSLFDPNKFSFYKKGDEYLYNRKDIASLKGNRFKSKRNAYNHFIKNYSAQFLTYQKDMRKECEALYEEWAAKKINSSDDEICKEMVKENRIVHSLALREYKKLGLIGRVVTINGEIKSYTFGYPLNSNTFCVLFEITDLKKKGLSVYTFREFCLDKQIRPFQYINVMDDFGMDNIKATKLSFRPIKILPPYVISEKVNKDGFNEK